MIADPQISVIVPVRHAARTVRSTLENLLAECRNVPAEIIAVVSEQDGSREAMKGLSSPALQVVVVPGVEGVPQLRRDGVRRARAPWVVITEDHCRFPKGWLSALNRGLPADGSQIRGGPVMNGCRTIAGWAQYFSRYTAFMPPVSAGRTRLLPGNNACYSRAVLELHADLLRDGFWEAEVNAVLARSGYSLWMAPELSVVQRQVRGSLAYAAVRYRHGRSYGGRRFRGASGPGRIKLLAQIPLIAPVLYWRGARAVFEKRSNRAAFLAATPLLGLYYAAWAVGEAVGYVFGEGDSSRHTD